MQSGIGVVWYQIPAPIRILFYSSPESGVHVTEMMTYDWSMIIVYVLMCFLVVITNSSSMTLSAMFIFGARNFHSRRILCPKTDAKNRRQKLESIYGADSWVL